MERGGEGGHLIETCPPYYCLIQSSLYLPTNIPSNFLKYCSHSRFKIEFLVIGTRAEQILERGNSFCNPIKTYACNNHEICCLIYWLMLTSHVVWSAIRYMKTSKWPFNIFIHLFVYLLIRITFLFIYLLIGVTLETCWMKPVFSLLLLCRLDYVTQLVERGVWGGR